MFGKKKGFLRYCIVIGDKTEIFENESDFVKECDTFSKSSYSFDCYACLVRFVDGKAVEKV